MLTAQQTQKYTPNLFSQIYSTNTYEPIKNTLQHWKDHNKSPTHAIIAFLKILHLISTQQPELLDDLNKCLLKEYNPTTTTPTLAKIK